jgi:hypothetical protein
MGLTDFRPRGIPPPNVQPDPLGFMQQQSIAPAGMAPPALSGLPDAAAVSRRPGMFGRGFQPGGAGRMLVGLLSDGLLQASGNRPLYAPIMQQRQQANAEEERWQRRFELERTTRLGDWQAQEAYKRAHPDDQFTQYMQAGGIDPASQQGQALYRQRAESMATPPMMAVDGFDAQGNPTKTFLPRAGIGMGQQQAPAAPAGRLSAP